ncbi:hypothetical protein [Mobiluncus mulieris]|nr:hypothetical protein [Mobiluncus mulieris]
MNKIEITKVEERRSAATILAPNSNHHPGPHPTTIFQVLADK